MPSDELAGKAAGEMEEHDLGAHIDAVIDSGVPDPADVAVKVLHTAPRDLLEEALPYLLKLAVQDRMSRRRSTNPLIRGAVALTRPGRVAPGGGKRARQRAMFAAQRARWLADPVWTGTRRLPLGEATVTDLLNAGEALRVQSRRLLVAADRYAQVAEAVRAAGVATVGELSDAALEALMSRD